MNKKSLIVGVMLLILPILIGIGLVYLNDMTVRYAQMMKNITWCLIWKGVKSIPIFAYVVGMFFAIKPVLVKQNRGVLSGCAFAGALIVILSFGLYMFGIVLGVWSIIMFANYQLLAPLAFCNIILGIYILRMKESI